ncbi:MAG: hypothetical protein J6S92_01995, partial [Oscillospiraceae bacterium]|nr:hypothetical protein [Oscillospiraceae bacterium]
MKKKLLSCLMAGVLAVQGFGGGASAAGTGSIKVDSVSVKAGSQFELPVKIERNPGIAALSLELTYEADKLELLGAKDGKILGTSSFLAGKDLTAIPYTMNWDDLSQSDNTGIGTVALLSFRAKENASGSAAVSVAVNQKSTFNTDMTEIPFTVTAGTVTFTDQDTEPDQTAPPAANGAVIQADQVTAAAGEQIEVPIRMQGNPGITALSLNISYDNTKLKLLGAADGVILGTSSFISGKDLSAIPYTLNWDDLAKENNTENGIVAKLRFAVLDGATGSSPVKVELNQKSTYNVDMKEVAFAVQDGSVTISGQAPKTTASVSSTTVSATTALVTTASTTVSAKTTSASVTTGTTAATAVSSGGAVTTLNMNAPAILVDHVSAQRTENVSVPIRIQNNPGIAGLSLNVSYDDEKLMLLGAADGKILGSATFLSGKDISAMPYTLNWDDLSRNDNTGNGVVATLVFMVLDDAEGTAAVKVAVNQKSTYNVKMQEVAFQVVNGSVRIYDPASDTKPFVTGTTASTVKTTVPTAKTTTSGTTASTVKTTVPTAKT